MLSSRVLRRICQQTAPVLKQSRNYVKPSSCIKSPQIGLLQRQQLSHRHPVSSSSLLGLQKRSFAVIVEPLESLGDSISTAVVLSWNKQPGEAMKEDEVIAVVETDKVTMDIRAKKAGVFVEAIVQAKGEATVGQPFFKMDTSASPSSASSTPTPAAAPAAPATPAPSSPVPTPVAPAAAAPIATAGGKETVVNIPVLGESITQGTVGKWFAKEGDFVKADQVVAQIDTDKVNVEVRAPHDGIVTKHLAGEGDEVAINNPFFSLLPATGGATAAPAAPQKSAAAAPAAAPEKKAEAAKPAASPAAPTAAKPAAKPAASSSAPSTFIGERTETRVKMTRMRQTIANRLKEAQNTAACLTTFQECDMTNLIEMRNKFKDDFEKVHGVKLGFMSAFVKAATAALQEIPAVNAVIDDETQEIVYRNYVDVSVAVASPNGLVVPVLRNTEKMSFADVEKTIAMYGQKAKEGKMAIEDMVGGTFTISNGGVFGSLFGTPIINLPQSAILGMHATKLRPVVVNGKVEARPMMYLALTYDHRMIDGREAVTFLKSIAQKIEDPNKLLLTL